MARGIKNKVAIIGMGCTKFGEFWDKSADDLIVEAFQEALKDAGIRADDIDAAWWGACVSEVNVGKSGLPLARALKFKNIPVTRVENFCATGTEAIRGASYAVASGACDIALALGCEKLKDTGFGGLPDMATGEERKFYYPNFTAPGMFAQVANAYFSRYGLSREEGKRVLSRISWKSHQNGSMNPRAHLRSAPDLETMVGAPIIADPLSIFDCCGVSDGAAAAIVVNAEMAKEFRADPIYVKALQMSLTPATGLMHQSWDGIHIQSSRIAGKKAYEEADITSPRKDISLMEVHDCFSINELITYECLQVSPVGEARRDVEAGFFDLDGTIPCQSDGGLKCFGHPIGASGIRMAYEIYKQLQGRAEPEERQIRKDLNFGLTHNLGGICGSTVCSVAIFGNEL